MKILLDKNGWTVHIHDLDPKKINNDEILLLKKLPYTNILAIIHEVPELEPLDYRNFCHKIFDIVQNDCTVHERRFLEGHDREIIRVTGRKNNQGEMMGLFGQPEFLAWHCNQPGIPLSSRPDCLTLYSVEGCDGSITAYTNTRLALQDLRQVKDAPPGLIKNLDKIDVLYSYNLDLDNDKTDYNYTGTSGKNKLVVKNKAGIEGILFSNAQTDSFYINDNKVPDKIYELWKNYLRTFLTQSKYVYDHHWKNNEITLNCQVLSQHARYPFDRMEQRMLWRIMGIVNPFEGELLTNFE